MMRSRLKFIGLVLFMGLIGYGLFSLGNRVDTQGARLEESEADRAALRGEVVALKKGSAALEAQVRGLGATPVVDPNETPPLIIPGPRGPVGPMGPRGRAGKNGKDGDDGDVGTPGTSGADGANGKDGGPGPAGPPGPSGPSGPAGADGKDGTNGADGKDGRSVESVSCDRGVGTFTFTYSDGTTQTVQCTPGAGE